MALNSMVVKRSKTLHLFLKEDYRFLPVRNKVVVYIGAGIGDSSIYFVSHGAKKVLALGEYLRSINSGKVATPELI